MTDTSNVVEVELAEEDRLLQSTLRDLMTNEGSRESARRWWSDDEGFDRDLWGKLSGLGVTAMVAPERLGGINANAMAAVVVAEELGRFVAAVPFEMHAASLVMLSHAFPSATASDAPGPAVLGASVITTAAGWPGTGRPAAAMHNGTLRGAAPMTVEGAIADAVLVHTGGEFALVDGGFQREHVATLGMNRYADLSFEGTTVAAKTPATDDILAMGEHWATLLFAARLYGLGDWMLDQCLDYARTRVQFGRPIGSFQATQHKLSEMHIDMTATRFLVRHAAASLDDRNDASLAISRAKALAGTSLWRVGREAHQIHGGVGFVIEHPLHLYFAAARGADTLLGGPRSHHARVGRGLLFSGFTPNALLGA